MTKKNQLAKEAVSLLVDRCPRLAESCYWAGTSSIAIEELGHRESFDLDFHTRLALVDVHPRDAGRARDLLLSWLKSEAEQT